MGFLRGPRSVVRNNLIVIRVPSERKLKLATTEASVVGTLQSFPTRVVGTVEQCDLLSP